MDTTALLLTTGGRTCAVPLATVIEVSRTLPVSPVDHPPPFVLGAAIVRGEAVPVVDVAAALGLTADGIRRFVSIRAGQRRIVLAVDDVLGVARFDDDEFSSLPRLLQDGREQVATAFAARDRDLYLVLDSSRLVPGDPRPGAPA